MAYNCIVNILNRSKAVKTVTEKKSPISRYYYLDMAKCLDENEDRFDAVISSKDLTAKTKVSKA